MILSRHATVSTVIALLLSPAASAGTIFVNDDANGNGSGTSFADAVTSLSDALMMAHADDQIFVAVGTYKPAPADPGPSFWLKDRVEVYGGFDGTETSLAERAGLFDQTILTQGNHIVRAQNVSDMSRLDGFRISDGVGATDDWPNVIHGEGGGMLLENSDLRVRNCTFADNRAYGVLSPNNYGGGASGGAVSIHGGAPQFVLCRFEGNGAYGADTSFKPTPAGSAWGGAVDIIESTVEFRHCSFYGNVALGGESSGIDLEWGFGDSGGDANGGAIRADKDSSLVVDHCVFSHNVARGGPGYGWYGYGYGGAVKARNVGISQCTVFGNIADSTGGLDVGDATNPAPVENSVLWANRESGNDGFDAQVAGVFTLSFCDVAGYTPSQGGTGNFAADPRLICPDGPDATPGTADDDLRLLPDSPCIDAGKNALVPADGADIDQDLDLVEPVPLDLALSPRFQDRPGTPDTGEGPAPVVDLGPYEHPIVCQEDLGEAGPGGPTLSVCGDDLTLTGAVALLSVSGASPGATILLVVGVATSPVPLLGGNLVPLPVLVLSLPAGPTGQVTLPVPGSGGTPVDAFVQAIAVDGSAATLSNAVRVHVGS